MIVQVQAAVAQRGGRPTTLVTGNAWKYNRTVRKRKRNKHPPLLITTTPQTQCNTSIYFKVSNPSESQPSTKMDYFVLSASFYSVDWLIGQSTWPTYAYERIFIKAFMSDDGLKLSYVRAINCTTMSDVNSLCLVLHIFCGAQDVSYHLLSKVGSLFSACQDKQVPNPPKKKRSIYVFFIYMYILGFSSSGLLSPGQPGLDGK